MEKIKATAQRRRQTQWCEHKLARGWEGGRSHSLEKEIGGKGASRLIEFPQLKGVHFWGLEGHTGRAYITATCNSSFRDTQCLWLLSALHYRQTHN